MPSPNQSFDLPDDLGLDPPHDIESVIGRSPLEVENPKSDKPHLAPDFREWAVDEQDSLLVLEVQPRASSTDGRYRIPAIPAVGAPTNFATVNPHALSPRGPIYGACCLIWGGYSL